MKIRSDDDVIPRLKKILAIEAMWKPWFAWRPVRLTHSSDGFILSPIGRSKTVWLKSIERLAAMPPGYSATQTLPYYRDPDVMHLFTPDEIDRMRKAKEAA